MGRKYLRLDDAAVMDLEILAETRTPLHVAAKRMGYKKPDTLIRNLYRKEREDLMHRLRDNSHQSGYSVHGANLKQPITFVRSGRVR